MFETIKNAWKVKEIRIKILITLALILLYRLGAFIPVAGINIDAFDVFSRDKAGTFLNIMDAVVGGSLSNGTLFAMGIAPYINASIIIQLLTVAIPAWERLSKEGEEGRKKLAKITRIATIILAIIQAVGILVSYSGLIDSSVLNPDGSLDWLLYILIIIQFAAGTALTMWIGERITELGIGNGMSLLIFAGILASAGAAIRKTVEEMIAGGDTGTTAAWSLISFFFIVIILFALIIWVDLAERKIPVQYAKQVKGRKMYGGQSTNIPIRINSSGVLPLIFAYALLSFPTLIIGMFNLQGGFATFINSYLTVGGWPYTILVSLLILFFAFFYAQIQFNPEDISRNIQQYGGFIPGIRPGKPTTDYLKKISNRITLFGAIFLALVALVPSLVLSLVLPEGTTLVSAVSTTGLLIIVSVALEFDKQLESQIMMRHYKGFLD